MVLDDLSGEEWRSLDKFESKSDAVNSGRAKVCYVPLGLEYSERKVNVNT